MAIPKTEYKQTVLLVDDDNGLLRLLAMRIEAAGFRVLTASSGEEALNLISFQCPDVVVTDMKMGGMDGMELFAESQKVTSFLPFVIITAHGTIPDAVDATQKGVFSFIPKPIDSQVLIETIRRAVGTHSPIARDAGQAGYAAAHGIITRNAQVMDIIRQAEKIATSDLSVLILGNCGTGKEVFARAIHNASKRKDGPFVVVNCSAIPENLLESELYGYEKGAFSGANRNYEGLFRAAHGGTIFLDEIGEMPVNLQAKLLRVLQESKVRSIGSLEQTEVDVRIISATNVDLLEAIRNKKFREDLYYRINVMSIALPDLADRKDDIPLLADHFLSTAVREQCTPPRSLAPDALEYLKDAPWPGNIRQLQNVISQLVALAPGSVISKALVQHHVAGTGEGVQSFTDARNDFERNYLLRVIAEEGGNVTKAAKRAKRNRTDFYKLLAKHNIAPSAYKKTSFGDDTISL
jgi:two-component system response regulator GlrR